MYDNCFISPFLIKRKKREKWREKQKEIKKHRNKVINGEISKDR
jgi:hypothetical protein